MRASARACHKRDIGRSQIVRNQTGGRSGVQKDDVAVFNHAGGVCGERAFFFPIEIVLGLHIVVVAQVARERGGAAVYLEQQTLPVQGGQIAADGGFRCAEMLGQLGDADRLLFVQEVQNRPKAFFR